MFTTPVQPRPSSHKISLHHPLCCLGSCFAQRMGQRWTDHKFTTLVNPFGTLYHPLSIARLVRYALENRLPNTSGYVARDGYYFHYDFHSSISARSQATLQYRIENILQQVREFLQTTHWMVITLGSSFVYERTETGQLVANCHQMPAALFRKRLTTVEEITEQLVALKTAMDRHAPDAHYLLTVSPVRHLRDTLEQNSVSKATLRLAAEQWRQTDSERIHYFPSYEIMLDELRDYRFYEADMLHPTPVAQDYLWEKLANTYLDEDAQAFIIQWNKIRRALEHRALRPDSEAHQRFLRQTLQQLKQLSHKVDVHTESIQLEQQLR